MIQSLQICGIDCILRYTYTYDLAITGELRAFTSINPSKPPGAMIKLSVL